MNYYYHPTTWINLHLCSGKKPNIEKQIELYKILESRSIVAWRAGVQARGIEGRDYKGEGRNLDVMKMFIILIVGMTS